LTNSKRFLSRQQSVKNLQKPAGATSSFQPLHPRTPFCLLGDTRTPKIGAAKVSLKAALRETGHCDRYKHHLEKKVPHHPNEEELISSLSFGL